MTNREMLLHSMATMNNEELADFLNGNVEDEISDLICAECQHDNKGICLVESLGLEYCPCKTSDWLQKEACSSI